MSDKNKTYIRDGLFTILSTIVLAMQSFFLIPILTKLLGVEMYGVWSQIKVTLSLIAPIALFGMKSALIRYFVGRKNKEEISQSISSSFLFTIISGTFFSVLLFIFSNFLSLLLTQSHEYTIYFKFASIILFVKIFLSVLSILFNVTLDFKSLSISQIINNTLSLLFALVFLYFGTRLWGVLFAFLFALLITIIYVIFRLRGKFKLVKPSYKKLKPLLSFGVPLTFLPILQWIFQVGDQYIIGYYLGVSSVGVYALAYSLAYFIGIIGSPLYTIVNPHLTKAWNQNDMKEFKRLFSYAYKYLFMIIIPASVGIIVLAKDVIFILSSNDFSEAGLILPVLCIAMILFSFLGFSNNLLNLKYKTKTIRNQFLFMALFNIILNLLFIPSYGIIGAAWATFVTFLLGGTYSIYIIHKNGLSLMPVFFIKALFSSGIMAGSLLLAKMLSISVYLKMFLMVGLGMIVYFGMMYFLRTITKGEINFFKQYIFNIINRK